MSLTTEQWHAQFLKQSAWTASLRAFLFNQANLQTAKNILEIGCGTGAITQSLNPAPNSRVFGIDSLTERVSFAHIADGKTNFNCADALALPFAAAQFDLCYCHYFLLWMNTQAEESIQEMMRVTRPGGTILALAEPDYSARIDFPAELIPLGQMQIRSLADQGACINMGRQLPGLFSQAGLKDIRFGQSGFQNNIGTLSNSFESEWEMLRLDLGDSLSPQEFARLKEIDFQAWKNGTRVLCIPTFYALGIVE